MNHLPRAEVVGSMLRPTYLKDARAECQAGRMSVWEFKRIEDRAVDEVIALQEASGVDVITDGEMRRLVFFDHFTEAIEGLEPIPALPMHFYSESLQDGIEFRSPVSVTGKIRRRRFLSTEEYTYARARATRPIKVTLPSPLLLSMLWSPIHSRAAYPDPFELFADGAELIRGEARELAALGCRYIQIDAPELAQVFCDTAQQDYWDARGVSVSRVASEGVDLVNSVAEVHGVRFAMHLCRGNFRSRWSGHGNFEELSRQVFPRATNYDAFLLEYDDDRSGSFEPLRNLPDDKVAVLGLISTKRDRLVSDVDIISRIRQACKFVALDRVAVSTQCGFASEAEGNLITEATQEAKLRTVSRVARRVWL